MNRPHAQSFAYRAELTHSRPGVRPFMTGVLIGVAIVVVVFMLA